MGGYRTVLWHRTCHSFGGKLIPMERKMTSFLRNDVEYMEKGCERQLGREMKSHFHSTLILGGNSNLETSLILGRVLNGSCPQFCDPGQESSKIDILKDRDSLIRALNTKLHPCLCHSKTHVKPRYPVSTLLNFSGIANQPTWPF